MAGLAFAALLHGGALALVWGKPPPLPPSAPPVLMARIIAAPVVAPPVPPPAPLPESQPAPQVAAVPPVVPPKPKAPTVVQKARATPAKPKPPDSPPVVAEQAAPAVPLASAVRPEPAPSPPTEVAPKVDPAGRCAAPDYPAASRRLQESGAVVLMFLIGPQGQVLESKIAESSGFERLDEAARVALARCRFQPGTQGGVPTQAWAKIRYVWRLT
ncbi:outer membrane transport energization protein TonB [Insolitispirillum peregrinum]|uniref:Outer membrane transport energization protein TonB n=2 Tax=Insolitispirillum peregrinum TaxID=80876 RepID=A0A1N7NKK9_9PROT|nr:outer membrane transport energization protein TonB [Insolitispirillum peregrinum]